MSTQSTIVHRLSQSPRARRDREVKHLRDAAESLQAVIDDFRKRNMQLQQQLDTQVQNLTSERNFWFHLANDFRFHYTRSVVDGVGRDEYRRADHVGGGPLVRRALKDLLLAPSEPDSRIARNSKHDPKFRRSGLGIAMELDWSDTDVDPEATAYEREMLSTANEEGDIAAATLKKREPVRIVNASKAKAV